MSKKAFYISFVFLGLIVANLIEIIPCSACSVKITNFLKQNNFEMATDNYFNYSIKKLGYTATDVSIKNSKDIIMSNNVGFKKHEIIANINSLSYSYFKSKFVIKDSDLKIPFNSNGIMNFLMDFISKEDNLDGGIYIENSTISSNIENETLKITIKNLDASFTDGDLILKGTVSINSKDIKVKIVKEKKFLDGQYYNITLEKEDSFYAEIKASKKGKIKGSLNLRFNDFSDIELFLGKNSSLMQNLFDQGKNKDISIKGDFVIEKDEKTLNLDINQHINLLSTVSLKTLKNSSDVKIKIDKLNINKAPVYKEALFDFDLLSFFSKSFVSGVTNFDVDLNNVSFGFIKLDKGEISVVVDNEKNTINLENFTGQLSGDSKIMFDKANSKQPLDKFSYNFKIKSKNLDEILPAYKKVFDFKKVKNINFNISGDSEGILLRQSISDDSTDSLISKITSLSNDKNKSSYEVKNINIDMIDGIRASSREYISGFFSSVSSKSQKSLYYSIIDSKNSDDYSLTLKDCVFFGKKINDLSFNYVLNKQNHKLNFSMKQDGASDFNFLWNVSVQDSYKPVSTLKITSNKFDFDQIFNFIKAIDTEKTINLGLEKQISFPSFLGLNGNVDIDVNNGTLKMEEFDFNLKGGLVNGIINISDCFFDLKNFFKNKVSGYIDLKLRPQFALGFSGAFNPESVAHYFSDTFHVFAKKSTFQGRLVTTGFSLKHLIDNLDGDITVDMKSPSVLMSDFYRLGTKLKQGYIDIDLQDEISKKNEVNFYDASLNLKLKKDVISVKDGQLTNAICPVSFDLEASLMKQQMSVNLIAGFKTPNIQDVNTFDVKYISQFINSSFKEVKFDVLVKSDFSNLESYLKDVMSYRAAISR